MNQRGQEIRAADDPLIENRQSARRHHSLRPAAETGAAMRGAKPGDASPGSK